MKFKNIIRLILSSTLSLLILYSIYYWFTHDGRSPYIECGKVVSKSTDEVIIKHGTRTDLYLNIQFEKSGFESVDCTPTLYFSKKVGDEVCITKYNKQPQRHYILYVGGFLSIIILTLFFIVVFLYWLFESEEN